MNEDREYVEARWQRAELMDRSTFDPRADPMTGRFAISLGDMDNTWWCSEWFINKSDAYSAARKFTEAREEEIRQVREEIEFMKAEVRGWMRKGTSAYRILAREQSALDALLKGMK
jgi:hypothetical protein